MKILVTTFIILLAWINGSEGQTIKFVRYDVANGLVFEDGPAHLSALGGQPQLSGTGFVKVSGTTVSYDNSTYLTSIGNGTITNAMLAGSIAYSKLSLAGAILNADLAGSIDAAKINTGVVSNAEFNYLDGVTSAIQSQIDAKQASDADLTTIAGLTATTDNFLVSVSSAWASRTPAQVRTTLGLATVATSGAYADISGVPTYSNGLTNASGVIKLGGSALSAATSIGGGNFNLDIGTNADKLGTLQLAANETDVNSAVRYISNQTATDANSTVSANIYRITLPTITAGRTLGISNGVDGREIIIANTNSSGFAWTTTPSGLIIDGAGNTVSTIPNGVVWKLTYNGTAWVINDGLVSPTSTVTLSNKTLVTPNITTGFTIGSAATGTILRGNGTNYVASTATFPNTGTSGDIIYATGSNAFGSLAIGTAGQALRTEDGAAPSYSYGKGQGSNTAATSGIANTETKIISSDVVMPANRLQAGTVIEVIIHGTTTTTAAGAGIFRVRYGTNGTTADGILESFTLAAAATTGTAIPFTARISIIIRTTGASATADGELDLVNNGITGISTTATQVVRGANTTISTATASTFLTLTYISGNASTTTTFQDAAIKISYK
jgi:hypothetical protein